MPEEEAQIFGEAYRLYEKWRSVKMTAPEQWQQMTEELHGFVCRHPESRLALRLAIGIMETMDDLYRNGKTPEFADYFGRSDL